MKLGKPTYNPESKVYVCKISDGFRFSTRYEEGAFVSEASTVIDKDALIDTILKATKGWFSKPLTPEFLKGKIQYTIPTTVFPEGFESFQGSVDLQMDELVISKEIFLFTFVITDTKEDEKVCIVFPEDEPIPLPLPLPQELPPASPVQEQLPPKRLLKQRAMELRTKAARALFHAERVTQEYCNQFGEDTEWEDEE
jgi:hypothetical protein